MTEKFPLISIVMPAYNVGKYIGKAIESVLNQSFQNWELIIVDDCSSDNTLEIVQEYVQKDSRIILIKRKFNSGGGRIPRFEAISRSKGKWLCTLDADDAIASDMFQSLLDRHNETGADMVLNRIIICRSNLEKTNMSIPSSSFDMSQIISGKTALAYTINGWKISVTCSLINGNIYRKYVEEADWDEFNGPFADELDHRKILITAKKIAFIDKHYYYRQHEASIVHARNYKSFEGIKNITHLLEFIQKECKEEKNVINEMHREFINKLYRYQIFYYLNKRNFSKKECQSIKKMLHEAYLKIRFYRMQYNEYKEKFLGSNYLLFRLTAITTASYIKIKS